MTKILAFRSLRRPAGAVVAAAAGLALAGTPVLAQDVAVPRPSGGGGATSSGSGGGSSAGGSGGGSTWSIPASSDGGQIRGGGRNPRSAGGGGDGGGGRVRSGGSGGGDTSGSMGAVPRRSPRAGAPSGDDGTYGTGDGRRPVAAPVYAVRRGSVPPPPTPPPSSRPGYWGGGYGYGGWGWGAWSPWWGYGALLPGFIYYDPFWWTGGYSGYGYGGVYPYGGSPYGYGTGYNYGGTYDPGSWTSSQSMPGPEDGDGSLRLRSKPGDAEVYVDGELKGRVEKFNSSWQKLKLPAGPHTIEIRKDGYETLRLQVIVQPGQTLDVGQDLRPTP
jgi:hypothetical protein